MLRQLLAASVAISGAASTVTAVAAAQSTSTGTSFELRTNSQCSTEFGSGATAVPTAIPVDSSLTTIESQITEDATTVAETSRVTAPGVTQTVRDVTSYTYADVTVTLSEYDAQQIVSTVVGTVTVPTTECTAGASQAPKFHTEYSGDYTPVSGQVQTVPASYPTRVVCETKVTVLTRLVPTVTEGTTTVTSTPTTVVTSATSTVWSTETYNTAVVYLSTVTKTTTTAHLASTTVTESASCATEEATSTYAAKCAPTNIIWGIEDRGLVSGDYANNGILYIDGDEFTSDPSRCCQLCVENENCAAMMAGASSSFCGLLYNVAAEDESQCGQFIYNYQTQSDVYPGQGLYVQSGCGTIEYKGSDGH